MSPDFDPDVLGREKRIQVNNLVDWLGGLAGLSGACLWDMPSVRSCKYLTKSWLVWSPGFHSLCCRSESMGQSKVVCLFFNVDHFKSPHPLDHRKSKRVPEKHLLLIYWLCQTKPLTVRITTNWKILKEKGIPHHLTCLLRNLYAGQETQQLELDMEQQIGSKSGNEYVKAVYCHPAYLTYMQSTSWEMPSWMNHKLESRLPGEKSTTSDI